MASATLSPTSWKDYAQPLLCLLSPSSISNADTFSHPKSLVAQDGTFQNSGEDGVDAQPFLSIPAWAFLQTIISTDKKQFALEVNVHFAPKTQLCHG